MKARKIVSTVSIILSLIISIANPAFGIEEIYQVQGNHKLDFFGLRITKMDDINGDNISEFAVSAPYTTVTADGAGAVKIFSGADGSELMVLNGAYQKNESFGDTLENIGDIDQDGFDDLAVGSAYSLDATTQYAGRVYVFSGKTGYPIHLLTGTKSSGFLGYSISKLGDVNSDNVPDFIISEIGAGPTGYEGAVHVISGKDGSTIGTVAPKIANTKFGASVLGLEDLDGDNVPDFAVGAYGNDPSGKQNAGTVHYYSGKTFKLLWEDSGVDSYVYYGDSLHRLEDLNGDGVDDYSVGASGSTQNKTYSKGYIELRSGKDASVIRVIEGQEEEAAFGASATTIGDLDGDGTPEIAVSSPFNIKIDPKDPTKFTATGRIDMFSPADGSLLDTITGKGTETLGWALASLDANGDGYPELLASAPNMMFPTTDLLKVFAYKLQEAPVATPTPTPTSTPAPTSSPTPSPTATPPAGQLPTSNLSAKVNKKGKMLLEIKHSTSPSTCSYRLQAASRKSRTDKGKLLISWQDSNTTQTFFSKNLPKAKGKRKVLWLSLERQCRSQSTWTSVDKVKASFRRIRNRRKQLKIKRIIGKLKKNLTQK